MSDAVCSRHAPLCVCVALAAADPPGSAIGDAHVRAGGCACPTEDISVELGAFGLGFMEPTFLKMKSAVVFHKKQERVKLGRWASWLNANRSWRHSRCALLLDLMDMGCKTGWFNRWEDRPTFDTVSPAVGAIDPDVASGAAGGRAVRRAPTTPPGPNISGSSSM